MRVKSKESDWSDWSDCIIGVSEVKRKGEIVWWPRPLIYHHPSASEVVTIHDRMILSRQFRDCNLTQKKCKR